ncbi:hypothetical protein Tco_0765864 [Tanacetum coccineum]
MATMAENVIAAGAENRPPMLEKGMYDSWKNHILLYIKGKENGEILIDSINNGPFQFKEPEWSRFVTTAKQEKDLHKVNFNQLYAYIKQNENDANEVRVMRHRFPNPLALLVNTYNPPPSYSRQSRGYGVNTGKGKATGTWVINTVGDVKANQPRKEQLDFLADGSEDLDSDCDDLQLYTTSIFKANHVDAFDSDYILSEVPPYDTHHKTDMLNPIVQETEYSEHLVSNNDSYDELTSDNNVISYSDYMVTIENDTA